MSSNSIGIANMIQALHESSYNITELCEHTGLSPWTVIRWMKLFKKRKLVRIVEWKKYGNGRNYVALYEWNLEGKGDVQKPKSLTAAERQANYRHKKNLIKQTNILGV